MSKLLYLLTNYLPAREINDGDRPYLERYYLGTLFGWRFYLHQFVGDDPDRGLHDHPWRRAFSLILSGFYYEYTSYGVRCVKWFNWLNGDSKHRVALPAAGGKRPCWTLFAHSAPKVKKWGFYIPIDREPDALLFVPYQYQREGDQTDWWLTAPKGRELRAKRGES